MEANQPVRGIRRLDVCFSGPARTTSMVIQPTLLDVMPSIASSPNAGLAAPAEMARRDPGGQAAGRSAGTPREGTVLLAYGRPERTFGGLVTIGAGRCNATARRGNGLSDLNTIQTSACDACGYWGACQYGAPRGPGDALGVRWLRRKHCTATTAGEAHDQPAGLTWGAELRA